MTRTRATALVAIGAVVWGAAVGYGFDESRESFERTPGEPAPVRTPAAAGIDDAGTPTSGSRDLASRLRGQLRLERERHRTRLVREVRARRATRADARRWRRALRADGSITRTIELSARAYGVPASTLLRKAWCESRNSPTATNGQYVGLFQFGAPLWSTTPYGDQARTDPLASSLAAAWAHANGYASHWECR